MTSTIYSGSATPTGALEMKAVATIALGGAEISAYDAASKKIFVTSNGGLQVVDLTNPAAPALVTTLTATQLGAFGDVTSVTVKNGIVAVALVDTVKTNPGRVVLLDAATNSVLSTVTVGALPDMLTFTPDGHKILVADEGEPLSDANGLADPVGRISIIDITAGTAAPVVTHAVFTAFDSQAASLAAQGVRLEAGRTVSQALEPEYIAVSPDGTKAMVTLQENNAVAIVDIATSTVTSIKALGLKDYGTTATGIDISDKDGIEIAPRAGVVGMYMPDAIASFTSGGQTYYVTANEGDAYDPAFGVVGRPDDIRVSAATLDPALVAKIVNADPTDAISTEADIKADTNYGRLTVSKNTSDTDGDGDLDQLASYGGRSFSIWDANGNQVFDSGNLIERATALLTPTLFNANDGVASKVDQRSDDKGAEPEGVTVGVIGGKTYAFVTLERAGGGVMAFDITDPANVSFAQYVRNAGDIAPEGVTLIDSAQSPNGKNLLAVANETSNTLTIYEVSQPFTLQILHYYGESGMLGVDTAPIMGAMIDKMDDEYANTLVLSEGDMYIPGPWLVAGADPSLNAAPGVGSTALGRPDIAIMNAFGTDASALGNHEFDLGSPVLQGAITPSGAWAGAQFPLITANVDVSADSSLRGLTDNSLGGTAGTIAGSEASAIKGKIAPYAVVTTGGEKVGLVGATTFDLLTKTSPNGTVPKDDANPATDDLQEVAAYLQNAVDALKAQGINKIVMVDQLDTLDRNKALAGMVSGIDIMIAGGGHERMGDATDAAAGFPGHDANFVADTYPIVTSGADGKPVLIVTTDTEYSYLGRLVVEFNSAGEIDVSKLDPSINGAYASTEATLQTVYNTTDSAATIIAGSTIGSKVQTIVNAIDAVVTAKDSVIYGYTNVYLEGDRVYGRTQEVNLGDISADANREAAMNALPTQPFMVSLKNGGGIRASIGSVDADGDKIPPLATDVKPAGAISQLDIENALRFDNKLMVFDTTAQGLKNIFEFAAGLSSGPAVQSGGYAQVGGIRFSYDPDNAAGHKLVNLSLIDDNGDVIARIIENGQIVADAPTTISVVCLNFTTNGGDGYPIKANATNFRYLLSDGTLSAPINPALDFTAAANVPANALGEQKAFQDYLLANYATPGTAYDVADTPASQDIRIESLNARNSDVVFAGKTIDGTNGANSLVGTAGDDTISGLGGNDVLKGGAGKDKLDGGAGIDTADYSDASAGVYVDVAAGAQMANSAMPTFSLVGDKPMLVGENGYIASPLLTIGTTQHGTTGDLNSTSAGDYTPVGILDGIGGYVKDADTVRLFVNHELSANTGAPYQLENGVTLAGARVSYIDIDKATKQVVDSGLAYGHVYDRAGNLVTDAAQLDQGTKGFDRFCSSSLYEANQFGTGKGLADRIYFTGEETSTGHSGTQWALDTATGDLWAVPMMGRGNWENVTEVDTGDTSHVAFLLGDDGSNGMPMYLYVGTKNAAGDFLDRNGLKDGKMYVWKANAAGVNSPAELASGTAAGSWVEIAVKDATKAGLPGYDALGYKDATTLRTEADNMGAFSFSRPEDLSTNPNDGKQIVFASTGASISSANTADHVADTTDIWGTVYTMKLDFTGLSAGAAPKAALTVLYNGNTDPTNALRSPDNVDWADDGYIYVNEDRSAAWESAPNTNEASVLRIDPLTGAISRIAHVDRDAVPTGQTDGNVPRTIGFWETSGVLDVSKLFGEPGGTVLITDVQAHGINPGAAQVEGGQLVLLAAPADTLTSIENVTGSEHGDTLLGDAGNNTLKGLGGDDVLDGRGGINRLYGGDGDDLYFRHATTDAVIENAGEGSDTVVSDITMTLGANVENLVLAGTADLNGFGNALDNMIVGNDGANILKGLDGADTTVGGAGDDKHYVDDASDVVIEVAGEGVDTVYTSVSYSIDGTDVERLIVNTTSGLVLTANDLANIITGGTGNDTVHAGEGDDRVRGGGGNDELHGEGGRDQLLGDEGDDVLIGGAGADRLTGGLGADTFKFLAASDSTVGAYDTILDFNGNDGDRIDLTGLGMSLTFIGTDAFNGTAGEVRMYAGGPGLFIDVDLDGNTVADMRIALKVVSGSDILL